MFIFNRYIVIFILGIIAIIALSSFLFGPNSNITVTNARVVGRIVQVGAPIAGVVEHIAVDRGDAVNEKEFLLHVGLNAAEIRQRQAADRLRDTVTSEIDLCMQWQQAISEEKRLKEAIPTLTKRYNKANKLHQVGALSEEEVDRRRLDLREQEARLQIARLEQDRLYQRITLPVVQRRSVEIAKNTYELAVEEVQKSSVYAPFRGVVYEVIADQGRWVDRTDPLLVLINRSEIRVEALVLEHKVKSIEIGQPVLVESDVLGADKSIKGWVEAIVPATAGSLAGVLRRNSDSNWIKVSQRIPIFITFAEKEHALVQRIPVDSTVTVQFLMDQKLVTPISVSLSQGDRSAVHIPAAKGGVEIVSDMIDSLDVGFVEKLGAACLLKDDPS